ncbi:sensor domain-containing diguanylate cyclase, partial [Candidatus Protofrankia californiensis]|uniref:sensor domain-containing diguanylate cyclase n=1 Tax=Candidatus Protofrankia californiensis TaxID=1839754 RepID=UPI001F49A059
MSVEPSAGRGANEVSMDQVFAAGGVMGRLMATADWAATTLGPLRDWGPTLRTAVNICLESGFPKMVLWGPELIMIYNDGYLSILDRKHPGCLGQPSHQVWPEIWDIMRPMLDQVMPSGGATWSQDQLLPLNRHGYLEECYFTFSLSPIRDVVGDGGVVGVMVTAQETTRQIFGTRRLTCLRELATATSDACSPREVCTRAVEALGRYSGDVPYSVVLLRDPHAQRPGLRPVASCGLAGDPETLDRPEAQVPELLSVFGRDAALPELMDALSSGQARIVHRLPERLPFRLTGGCRPPNSAIVVPLAEGCDGLPIGLLLAGISDRLAPDGDYRDFAGLVAGQISTAVLAARANEVERARAADARHRALHDELTGLPNRTALLDQLHQALAHAQRHQRRVAVLFVDLDGFKTVNDSLGHQAGDDLLREVAAQLLQTVRPGDTVARFSG